MTVHPIEALRSTSRFEDGRRLTRTGSQGNSKGIPSGWIERVRVGAGVEEELADTRLVSGRRQHQRGLALSIVGVEVIAPGYVDANGALYASYHRHSQKLA